MKKLILFIVMIHIIGGIFAANLYAKEKEKGAALQCQLLVAADMGDFSSIQDAIDYLNPEPDIPCTIIVAAGTYTESIQISKSHIHLKGSGSDRTTLIPAPDSPAITLDGVNNVKISGFSINDSNFEGIRSSNSSLLIIDKNQFVRNDIAIYIEGGENITIDKNVFDLIEGISLGSISIKSSQHAVISDNFFIGGEAITTGIENAYGIITTTSIVGNTFTSVNPAIINYADRPGCWTKIVGNVINGDGVDTGIRNRGPAVISENTIEKCTLFGISNDANQAIISNNLLRGNQNPGGSAISTSGTSTITGNIILDNQGNGVNIIGGIATINGNSFINNGGYGVQSSGRAIVMGNTFVDNALGCTNDDAGTVGANLCNYSAIDITGKIVSDQDLVIEAGLDLSIIAGRDLGINAGGDIPVRATGDISTSAVNSTVSSSNDTIIDSNFNTTITSGSTTITSTHDITLDSFDNIELTAEDNIYLRADTGAVYSKPIPVLAP